MSALRSLLFVFVLMLGGPLYAAETTTETPAELKKQIEAVNRESATLDAENAELRKKISELEQKTRELVPQVMTAETPSAQQAPAKPARKKVVLPPEPAPEVSFLDTLLADPMMLGGAAGAILLLGALVVVKRRRSA